MWMFGDVWSTPEECRRLGELIERGLETRTAAESHWGGLRELPDGSITACVQTLALIGHYNGRLGAVWIDLTHYGTDRAKIVSKFTGVGIEILKRATRWHLVENLSAHQIAARLLNAT